MAESLETEPFAPDGGNINGKFEIIFGLERALLSDSVGIICSKNLEKSIMLLKEALVALGVAANVNRDWHVVPDPLTELCLISILFVFYLCFCLNKINVFTFIFGITFN